MQHLFVDQYGAHIYANGPGELCYHCGKNRRSARRIYVDRPDGIYHIGYAVGKRWFTRYAPVEVKQ